MKNSEGKKRLHSTTLTLYLTQHSTHKVGQSLFIGWVGRFLWWEEHANIIFYTRQRLNTDGWAKRKGRVGSSMGIDEMRRL